MAMKLDWASTPCCLSNSGGGLWEYLKGKTGDVSAVATPFLGEFL